MKSILDHLEATGRDPSWRMLPIVFAVTGLLSVGPARAAEAAKAAESGGTEVSITASVDVTPPAKPLTSVERRALSVCAGRLLKHVDQALDALADKKMDAAKENLQKAILLDRIVESILPATTVKTEIKGGGESYDEQDLVKPTFIPIYQEFDEVDVISPVLAQKQSVPATVGKPAETKTSGEAPPAARTPQMSYADLDYTSVKLNWRLAKRRLLQAEEMIKHEEVSGATTALQDIQTSAVIFEYSSESEPLVSALNNLSRADSEVKKNQPEKAKSSLQRAAQALKTYAKRTKENLSSDVTKLHQEVDGAAKYMEEVKDKDLTQKIGDWWHRCEEWLRK